MRKQWETAHQKLLEFHAKLQGLINMLPKGHAFSKHEKEVAKLWGDFTKSFHIISEYISDVDAVEVEMPNTLKTQKFLGDWKYWKEYLVEQHGVHMKSRMENKQLQRLLEISGNNAEAAAKILDLAIATGYRNFFKPNQDANNKTEPDEIDKYAD